MKVDLAVVWLVPGPLAGRMTAARAASGDKGAGSVEPHVTLVPPVGVTDVDAAVAHAREVCSRHSPFELRLRGTGTFRPVTKVVHVAVDRGVEELAALEAQLREGPLHRHTDFAFNPHATIAMRVGDEALDAAAAPFAGVDETHVVTELAVLRRDADRVWRTLELVTLG